MNFSRMDLADDATPEALLRTINKLQKGSYPIPIPIEEWARALDITDIQELETEGFEGGLLKFADGRSATILVSKHSKYRRRRFTIGHELGHFLLPWHTPRNGRGFMCSSRDMSTFQAMPGGDRYMEMEVQANQFAAGILMPTVPFRADLRQRRNFEVAHVVELAERYNVSKEATARRCADLSDDAIALVISQHGRILRVYTRRDFPRLAVWIGQTVPNASTTRRATLAQGECSAWSETHADTWLTTNRGAVCEQVLGQADGFRLTLLTFEGENADNEEEEEVERAWSPPAFRRR